jgi:hypothetical protein
MPKTPVPVTVNFNTDPPTCVPDPVHVSRANNTGVNWQANVVGYTFTGVSIDGHDAPTGEFGTPSISTGPNNKSQMFVSDANTDLDSHKYTLKYTDPAGNARTYDPRIKNDN